MTAKVMSRSTPGQVVGTPERRAHPLRPGPDGTQTLRAEQMGASASASLLRGGRSLASVKRRTREERP